MTMEVDKTSGKNGEMSSVPNNDRTIFNSFPRWREAMFLTSVAGISMLFGFGTSLSSAKKQDPSGFDQGMTPSRKFESGAALASRALKWGTIYAFTGCGLLFFTVWKLMGVKDLQEFRMKVGNMLPRIPKNNPPQGRTEFENLTDFLQYIIDEDIKAKAEKAKRINDSQTLKNDSSNVNVVQNDAVNQK